MKIKTTKKMPSKQSLLLTDVPGLTDALTGSAVLRKALTDALNKSALIPGALVQLKSGGPVMTLERLYNHQEKDAANTRAFCVWYSMDSCDIKRVSTHLTSLQLASK